MTGVVTPPVGTPVGRSPDTLAPTPPASVIGSPAYATPFSASASFSASCCASNTARCAASVGGIPAPIKSSVISCTRSSAGAASVGRAATSACIPSWRFCSCFAATSSCARTRPSAICIATSGSIPLVSTILVAVSSTCRARIAAFSSVVGVASVGSTRLGASPAFSPAASSITVSVVGLPDAVRDGLTKNPFSRISCSAVGIGSSCGAVGAKRSLRV